MWIGPKVVSAEGWFLCSSPPALADLHRMKLHSSRAVGTEVGFSLAHSNPFFSLDPGSLEHLTLSPRAVIGPGARFVEFFHTGIPRRRRTEREVAGRNSVTPARARNCSTSDCGRLFAPELFLRPVTAVPQQTELCGAVGLWSAAIEPYPFCSCCSANA